MTTETQRSALMNDLQKVSGFIGCQASTPYALTMAFEAFRRINDFVEKALTPPAVADKHWHDDINDAVACAASLTVERMETAITACQSWDTAGLVNEGLVTDMATAYLQSRKAQGVTDEELVELVCRRLHSQAYCNSKVDEEWRDFEDDAKEILSDIKAATAPNACAGKGE